MNIYIVQSGDLDVVVEAKNHNMAAIKAIDEHNPKELGVIVSVLKFGDSLDDELYMQTEPILKVMGYEYSKIK